MATAIKLARRLPEVRITLLEKEPGVGRHQSTHNSGVLHCGLYYKPGSLKARLAVSGVAEMTQFCREHGIPHEVCGKLVVAVDEPEVARLKDLQDRGTKNGLAGLRWLGPEAMREIEPHVGGVAALHVPQEGIVDYAKVCATMLELITKAGNRVVTSARVNALRGRGSGWVAETTAGDFEGDFVVNCAGLHSDRVSELAEIGRAHV